MAWSRRTWVFVALVVAVLGVMVAGFLTKPKAETTPASVPPATSAAPVASSVSTAVSTPQAPVPSQSSSTSEPSVGPTMAHTEDPSHYNDMGEKVVVSDTPVIAPADLSKARDTAMNYWVAMNTYGAGDDTPRRNIKNALPYLTDDAAKAWSAKAKQVISGSDLNYWNYLVARGAKHAVSVVEVEGIKADERGVDIAVTYRSGILGPNDSKVNAQNPTSIQHLWVSKDGGRWRVDARP